MSENHLLFILLAKKISLTQFNLSVQPQQYVIALNIPVYNMVGVQEVQRLQHLPAHGRDLPLVHARLRHHVRQGPAGQVLHYYPQLLGMGIMISKCKKVYS